ncbi:MAG: TlpA disulfide reductase family protein [Anaerolineae bacterium]
MTDTTLRSLEEPSSNSNLVRIGWIVATAGILIVVLIGGFILGRQASDDSKPVELGMRPVPASRSQPIAPVVGVTESNVASASLDQAGAASLGQTAPDFSLKTTDGQTVRLSDLKGHPVLVNFWATWCAPCAIEMPALEEIYRKYKDQGLVVLAVNQAETPDKVSQYMLEHGLTFPAVLDSDTSVAQMYRVTGYPTTWIIDRQGKLQQLRRGGFTSASQIEPLVAGALALGR